MAKARSKVLLLLSYAFKAFCVCGSLYQVVIMSMLYFEYRVATKISIAIHEAIEPIATTMCFRTTDILDYERLNEETGRDWKYTDDFEVMQDYKRNMTVTDMFNYTPADDDVVDMIYYRDSRSYAIPATEKRRDFNVTKFLYSLEMCYKISIREGLMGKMRHIYVTESTVYPGFLSEIRPSKKFAYSQYIRIALAPADVIPRRSIRFVTTMKRGNWKNAKFNPIISHFQSQMVEIRTISLPAPYETDCWIYSGDYRTEAECQHKCMERNVIRNISMVPFSSFIFDHYDKKLIIDTSALGNKTALFDEIRDKCYNEICSKEDCNDRIFLTMTSAIPDKWLKLKAVVPNIPSIERVTSPKTDFIEYFTFVVSNIGTWLGVSILWFDPIKLIRLWEQKDNNDRNQIVGLGRKNYDVSRYGYGVTLSITHQASA